MISLWWSFALTAIGVTGLVLVYRSQSLVGPLIGLGVQLLWIAYAVATRQWFPAKYPGRCECCGDSFDVGAELTYPTGYDRPVLAAHLRAALDTPETPCPQCWTVHRGECI